MFGDILTSCFLTCTKVVPFCSWAAAGRAAPALQKPRGVRSGFRCTLQCPVWDWASGRERGTGLEQHRAARVSCGVLQTCRSEGCFLVAWVICRAGQWSCCVKVTFFLKKILGMSLFLLVVTRFCVNYVLLVRLKIRRAALIANTFLFLQLLLLCYYKRGDRVIG